MRTHGNEAPACWEHNLNSINLLEVVKVLEKGLEQHTKKNSEGFPVGFCKPGNFSETGTTKNLWFGVVSGWGCYNIYSKQFS